MKHRILPLLAVLVLVLAAEPALAGCQCDFGSHQDFCDRVCACYQNKPNLREACDQGCDNTLDRFEETYIKNRDILSCSVMLEMIHSFDCTLAYGHESLGEACDKGVQGVMGLMDTHLCQEQGQ
jgi:hypothetical protein